MYLSKKIASLPIRRAQYTIFATDLAFLCWLAGAKIFPLTEKILSLRGKAGLQTLGTFILNEHLSQRINVV